MITIYTIPNCKYCKEAKELMDKMKVPYEEINLKDPKNRAAREFYRSQGVKSAPIITGTGKNGSTWALCRYNEKELLMYLEK